MGRVTARPLGWIRRPPLEDFGARVEEFRRGSIGLLRSRWGLLVFGAYLSELSVYLVLLVSLRLVGVDSHQVSWSVVLASFALVRILQSVPITPGGVGVVELGLTAALVAAGGDHAGVVAGVLVFRAFTWLPPLVTGPFFYLGWRRWLRRNHLDADFVAPDHTELTHEAEVIGEAAYEHAHDSSTTTGHLITARAVTNARSRAAGREARVRRRDPRAGRLLGSRVRPSRRGRRERRPAVATADRRPSAPTGGVPETPLGDELFACPPSQFVQARNALVRRLRASGDREAAEEVTRLRRPTPSVWALNQVARQQSALVDALGEAGDRLRAATEDALAGDSSTLRPAQDAARAAVDVVVEAAEALLVGVGDPANAVTHQRMVDTLRATSTELAGRRAAAGGPADRRSGLGRSRPRRLLRVAPADRRAPPAADRRRAAGKGLRGDQSGRASRDQTDRAGEGPMGRLDGAARVAEADATSLEHEARQARRQADRAAASATTAEQLAAKARERGRRARAKADASRPV